MSCSLGAGFLALSAAAAALAGRGVKTGCQAPGCVLDRFTLYSQPILDLQSNQIVRHELLALAAAARGREW